MDRQPFPARAPGRHSAVESPGAAPIAPGKCTLTQRLVVQRRDEAAASEDRIHAAAARGTATPPSPLPHAVRIQRLFGRHDISGIQAHLGSEATASAGAMGARAYATGNHIVLGDRHDLFTVAHEAAHVVQQRGSVQLQGGVGAHGDAYERHADQVAERVVAGQSAEALLGPFASAAAGAASRVVQRAPDYRSWDEIEALRLFEFDRYAHDQADWAVSDALGDKKEALRGLLAFARRDKGMVLGACRGFSVKKLIEKGLGQGGEIDRAVAAYSRSASPAHNAGTIHVEKSTRNFSVLVEWGAAILKLHDALGGLVAESVVVQREGMPTLQALVEDKAVDDFIVYCGKHHPVLHAANGREIFAFLEFRKAGLAKLDHYKAKLPEIKNFHRFTEAQLMRLCQHRAAAANNPSAQQPLPICAVLQTGLDSSGAFYQNDNLTKVIMRDTHLVLVAEGKANLGEFARELGVFAEAGAGGKLDEILLTAHGNTTQLKLAGTVGVHTQDGATGPEYSTTKSSALKTNPRAQKATRGFIGVVKTLLRDHPDARIVLNGCLTNASNLPKLGLAEDPDDAAAQIVEAMAKQPNLTAHLQKLMAPHQGQVRGANASFPPALMGLLDADGRIDLHAPEDLALTAPDKITYLEFGAEPSGVLRSMLEVWARERDAALQALRRRYEAKTSDLGWPETVIRAVAMPILKNPDNASLIQTMIECAAALSHLKSRQNCRVAKLAGKVPGAFLPGIFQTLCQSVLWTNIDYDYVPAVVLQVWLAADPGMAAAFIEFLDHSEFTTQNAGDIVDLKHLEPFLGQLLASPMPEVAPPRGPLLLALLYLAKRRAAAPDAAKQYVFTLVGNACAFPERCHALLKGVDERRMLKYAGVLADEAQAAQPPKLNVAGTHGGENDVHVESLTMQCKARDEKAGIPAYALPSGVAAATLFATALAPLHVIGRLTWTCPDEARKTKFQDTAEAADNPEPKKKARMEKPQVVDTPELETEDMETETAATNATPRARNLKHGKLRGEKVEMLAVETTGPHRTLFIEQHRVTLMK